MSHTPDGIDDQITFGDIHLARQLFGEHNANLNRVADSVGVRIHTRGNVVFIQGEAIAAARAGNL